MEKIDVLDENGNNLNRVESYENIHKLGLWHRAIIVFILNKNNEILIQQRASSKSFFPNMWELSVTGHVDANELSTNAALREINEETGLKFKLKDIHFIYSFRKEYLGTSSIERLFFDVFYIRKHYNKNKIKIQESEVQNYKITNLNEIKKMIKNGELHIDNETMFLLNKLEKGELC